MILYIIETIPISTKAHIGSAIALTPGSPWLRCFAGKSMNELPAVVVEQFVKAMEATGCRRHRKSQLLNMFIAPLTEITHDQEY
jgi:hypothetical protein